MKNTILLFLFMILALTSFCTVSNTNSLTKAKQVQINGEYILFIEGFDWGAAASKVVLLLDENISSVDGKNFSVEVNKATNCAELSPKEAEGTIKVQYAYVSDAAANRAKKGQFITLVLYAAPFDGMNSPLKYFGQNPKCPGNAWIDFKLTITNKSTEQIWNQEKDRIIPLVDNFDLSGTFTHKNVSLTYADYEPSISDGAKKPLLIWLHGGGEGGTDPSTALLANRAANYAAPEIQAYFDGAYVLVPQATTFWMDNGKGQYTRGEVNDTYNESLMALIKNYVDQHPSIDKKRIYVGGCSNGGYMTLKLLMLHPDYFAAGFPVALAYHGKYLTEKDIQNLKKTPMWFVHSKDDPVTKPKETVLPTYQQLKEAGAKNVHFSFFEHVVDLSNQHGGESFHYNGHFSWIYAHTNQVFFDYDGQPVKVDGQPVSLMGWLARQRRQ